MTAKELQSDHDVVLLDLLLNFKDLTTVIGIGSDPVGPRGALAARGWPQRYWLGVKIAPQYQCSNT